MATGKKYYWIKLKESFVTSDTVDYFMSQKNGARYVVLYQILCLKTMNTNGKLARKIGEIIIPYDAEKINRDCSWFSIKEIKDALKLYKSFGLVYEDKDGNLAISDYDSLIGSETDWANKKRKQRDDDSGDNVPFLSPPLSPPLSPGCPQNVPTNVPIDIRDRERYRDKINNSCFIGDKSPGETTTTTKKFKPPTVEEVQAYCSERQNNIDAEKFVNYYTATGWKVGRHSMKDWKAAVRTWESNDTDRSRNTEIGYKEYKGFDESSFV